MSMFFSTSLCLYTRYVVHWFCSHFRSFEPHDHKDGKKDTPETFIGLILNNLLHKDCKYHFCNLDGLA